MQFKIDKPIRLIELFAGYGSQHFALEYLGAKFESWKICEWAVKSIQAYKDAHIKGDFIDYSNGMTQEDIVSSLYNKGISSNYNNPMTYEQIKRLGETKQRQIFNNIYETNNLVNIQQIKGRDLDIIETNKYCYVVTYSFPCQDLSIAGLGKGMEKGGKTRSGMLWEVERILEELKQQNKEMPQVLIMENVPQVHGKKNKQHFDTWIEKLKELGYSNYWKDLNSKNYKVPQNRKRCFMVSIYGDYEYEFPKEENLELTLQDLLEDNVDESYFLSDKQKIYAFDMNDVALNSGRDISNSKCNQNIAKTISCRGAVDQRADVTNFIINDCKEAISVKDIKQTLKKQLCNKLIEDNVLKEGDIIRHSYTNNRLNNGNKNLGRIESKEHLSPTLDTRCDCLGVVVNDTPKLLGGIGDKKSNNGTQWYQQDRIYDNNVSIAVTTVCNPYYAISGSTLQKEVCNKAIEKGLVKPTDVIDYTYSNSRLKEIENGDIKTKNSNDNNIFCTLTTNSENFGVCVNEDKDNLRIRKLTPKECFRLMGVKDQDFEKIAQNQSNASLYHLAGDSIVVDVLMAIFKQML